MTHVQYSLASLNYAQSAVTVSCPSRRCLAFLELLTAAKFCASADFAQQLHGSAAPVIKSALVQSSWECFNCHICMSEVSQQIWNAKNVTKLESINHKEMRQCLWLNIGTIQDWQYLPVPTQQNCLVYHIIRHESTLDVKIGLKRSLISISEDTISRLPCFGGPVCFWTTSRKSRPGLVLPPAQGRQKQQRWLCPGCQPLGSSFLQVPKRSTNKMMNENYTTLRTKQTISIGKRLFLGTFSSKQERLKGRVFTNQVHEVEPHWKVCNQIVISLCNLWMLRTMLAQWVQ